MTPANDRLLTDGQAAGLLGIVALAVAATPLVLGLSSMAMALALFVAALIAVGAIGIASGRAEYGEPPRRTG